MILNSIWRSWIVFVLLHFAVVTIQQDFTCSPTKPCASGCCSNTGVCGLGPTFCGSGNCTSSCDQKSQCDPGWGSQWSTAEKCPLNVCCSQFGFCGTGSQFCGANDHVNVPSCSGLSATQRTIAYYEGWSPTRPCDAVWPETLKVDGYTHINFAFAFIDPKTYAIAPMDSSQQSLFARITALKDINPSLEVWISIGGWSMNEPTQPTAATFSDLAGSATAQAAFGESLISFMTTYGFDGVDIDVSTTQAPAKLLN